MADDKRSERSDLRRELNALWRSTVEQFDELKDAIVRSSSAGKAKLDATLLRRERDRRLAEVGEAMIRLADEGKLELPDELAETVERIRALEKEIREQEAEVERVFRRAEKRQGEEGLPGEAASGEPPEKASPNDEAGA